MPAVHHSPRLTVSTCHAMSLKESLTALDTCAATRQQNVRLRETLGWIAQTIHQGYHEGPLEGCAKPTCDAARLALKVAP